MFSLESFEKTSGGTSSRHMWRMYANVSSVDFSPSARKGFSNSDSHFDREARECSSFSSKNFVEVNLLLTSSKASSPIGTLTVSTLWPLFLCRSVSGCEQGDDLVRQRQPRLVALVAVEQILQASQCGRVDFTRVDRQKGRGLHTGDRHRGSGDLPAE